MHFLQISSQDVKGCMSTAEISKQLNLQSIRKHKYQIQPCCALTGEGYVKLLTCALNKGYETITKDRIIDTILTGLIQVVPRPRVDRQQHQESVIDSRRCRLHIPTPHPTHHHPALRPFVS